MKDIVVASDKVKYTQFVQRGRFATVVQATNNDFELWDVKYNLPKFGQEEAHPVSPYQKNIT